MSVWGRVTAMYVGKGGVMSSAGHIGRVGALAVALGVGFAVAQAPLAAASPENDASTGADGAASSQADNQPDPQSAGAGDAAEQDVTTDDEDTEDAEHAEDADEDGAPDGSTTDPEDSGAEEESDSEAEITPPSGDADEESEVATTTPARGDRTSKGGENKQARVRSALEAREAVRATPVVVPSDSSAPQGVAEVTPTAMTSIVGVSSNVAVADQAPAVSASAPATEPVTVTTTVLDAVSQSLLGNGPGGPVESPLSWIVLAAARRFGSAGDHETTTSTVSPIATSLALDSTYAAAAVTVNLPPVIGPPVFGTPDPTTGAVTGTIVATDPELKKLTYALVSGPAEGTLVFDKKTGGFTYTPTAAQRILAQVTPGEQTVFFTASVSDGSKSNIQTTTVTVAINPTRIADIGEVATGAGSMSVAVTNSRAYVANYNARTISVIDTINGVKITDIMLANPPIAVAVTPDGSKVYVADDTSNLITVVNGTTNQLLAPIDFGSGRYPLALTVAPDGKQLYVTGALLTTKTGQWNAVVTRVSTTTGKILGTVKLAAASPNWFEDISVTPDGKKIYAIGQPLDGSTASAVYTFTSTSTSAKVVAGLGPNPVGIAFSPDSTRAYIADRTGTVRILDTKTNLVTASITTGGTPSDVAVNKDGTLLMVVDSTATTIKVYDIRTSAYAQVTTVPTNAATGDDWAPVLALSPDGMQLYFTSDGALQVVSLVPANTKPVAGRAVSSPPNLANGVVTGTVGVTDANNDRLTYSALPSAKGSLVVNANGTFTYTPTAAARHNAATGAAGTLTDTLTVIVSDGRRGIVNQTITVAILPANEKPVVTFSAPSPSSVTGIVKGSVIGTDKDKDVLTYTSTGVTAKGGSVTIDAKGKFTYTPTTAARYVASLATAAPADKLDTFTVTVSDGHGAIITQLVTVKVSPKSTKPKYVMTSGGTTSYTEQQGPVVVDGSVTLTNPDAPSFSGATAALTAPQTGDALGFTAPAGSGITGSYSAATGILSLTGTSSVANYQAALRSVTFRSTTDTPPATKIINFTVINGPVPSSVASKTISIIAVNDAPAVATSGGATPYTEQQGAVVIDGALTVTDVDSPSLAGATATLTAPQAGDTLKFTTPTGSRITGTYNATTGVLTLAGSSSVANYQRALRSVTFVSSTDAPVPSRIVTFSVTDGLTSAPAAKTLSVTAVNDAPILSGGGSTISAPPFTPVKVAPNVTVGDPDGGNLAGATVTITAGRQAGADALALTPLNGITGSYNSATGVLSLTGTSSVANYQAALRSVTFSNNSANPVEGARTITISVTDGALPSNTVALTAAIKVNHAPVAVNDAFNGTEDKPISGNVLGNDSDPDANPLTINLGSAAAHGILNLASNGSFTYTPDVNYHGTDSFTYTAFDGFATSNTGVVTLTIAAVDDVVFQFNYGSGSQYWTPEAQASLQRAANRMSEYIATDTPVKITYDITGVIDPGATYLAFASSPIPTSPLGYNLTYVQRKILSSNHFDSNGTTADGKITVNFAYTFEYADAITVGEYDFQTVAMHEIMHTLGLVSLVNPGPNPNRYWTKYDEFIRDSNGINVIGSDYRWNSAYDPNLSGGNGGLYFGGLNAVIAYGGLVPLQELSFSHLRGSSFLGAARKLMVPNTLAGTNAQRKISLLELGILKDLGYTVASQAQAVALGLAATNAQPGAEFSTSGIQNVATVSPIAATEPAARDGLGERKRRHSGAHPRGLTNWYLWWNRHGEATL